MKASEFKKLIKEAVREVLLEELSNNSPKPIQEQINTPYIIKHNDYQSTGDPLLDLLNETKDNGDWRDLGNFQTENIQNFKNQFMPEKSPQVGDVGAMLTNTNKNTSDINQVEIDVVPNFSKLMGNMKDKGLI
jgi:hypothetical protein